MRGNRAVLIRSPGKSRRIDLLHGNIPRTLLKLTGPMVLAMMAMVLFNLVDTIYVGRLGTKELAAMAFTFPVVFFFTSITGGLGMGATSVIARTLGSGDERRASRLIFDSLILSMLVAVVSTMAGLATIGPLFRVMNAGPEDMVLIRDYMGIWYFGITAVVIPMVGNAIIRSTGDTKTPMKIMLFAVTVNVVLDPLLIFGLGPFPRMGLAGAALATVIARVTTMFLALYVLVRVKKLLKWDLPSPGGLLRSWKDVLHVGAPNAVVNALTPLSQAAVTAIVAGYGVNAKAGFGAATRLEGLVIMPIIAFCTVLVPFIGQNYGSGRVDRVRKAISIGFKLLVAYGLVIYIIISLSASLTGPLFNPSQSVVRNYSLYLWLGGLGWVGLGMCYVVFNSFNAMGRPLPSAVITLLRVFALIIPLALMGSMLMDLRGVFLGIAVANGLAAILAISWIRKAGLGPVGKWRAKSNSKS